MIIKKPVCYTIYRAENPKAIVEVVHGMMDHRKRYDYFAKSLCAAGFTVITYDQRGHGETAENPEDFGFFAKERGWKLLIDDCLEINKLIRQENPELPFILFGHSMGSLVVRSFLKRYDKFVDGVILCGAPNYNPASSLGYHLAGMLSAIRGKKSRSKLLKKLVMGSFNKKVESPKTSSDWISKNEENVQEYIHDPLCQFNFTNAAYEDLMFGMRDMHDTMRWNLQNPDCPILFIAGENDACCGGEKGLDSSEKTLKEAGYNHVERIVYASLRHEILNEKEKDKIIQDCIQWMNTAVIDTKNKQVLEK